MINRESLDLVVQRSLENPSPHELILVRRKQPEPDGASGHRREAAIAHALMVENRYDSALIGLTGHYLLQVDEFFTHG